MLPALKPTTWMAVVFIFVTGAASIAWQNNPVRRFTQNSRLDTIPEKGKEDKTVITGDINKAIDQVNRAKENLERELQHTNWEKMHRDLEKSLEKLNTGHIEEQVAKALQQIDMKKIQLEAQAALKQVDWEKIQQEIKKAQAGIKQADIEKMQKDMQQALEETKKSMAEIKAVDMKKMLQELEHVKEEMKLNEDRMREDIEKAKNDVKKAMEKDFKQEMEKAKEEVNRAAAELQNYKAMLNEMDKDGLLKSNETYNVEYKKGELIINGKKQPASVTTKYRHYFKKENVQIKKGKDDNEERTIHL